MNKILIGGCIIISMSLSLSCAQQDVIRVQYISDDDETIWEKSFSLLVPELEKRNIRFVKTKPDVIICHVVTDSILQKDVPVIKLERWSSATIKKDTFDDLKNPLVKGIFKNTILEPIEMFNEIKQISGRYHFELTQRYAQLSNDFAIIQRHYSSDMLKKLFLVPWNCHANCFAPRLNSAKETPLDLDQERPIDVFFVCSLHCNFKIPEVTLYCWHRKRAYEAVKNMSGVYSLVIAGRPLKYDEYTQKMKESKIVISPWGWGEWCYRDCEAMVNGAVLIKPDTSFVKTIPQLYINNVTYVPCQPDFSDLEEKVSDVLANYDQFKPMRKRARKIMVEETNPCLLAERFIECLHAALAQ